MIQPGLNGITQIWLDSVKSGILAIAEIGGNKILNLDDRLLPACESLQGKCIAIEITDLQITIYCHPGNWGIRLSAQAPAREVDATISGRIMALINLASNDDKVSTSIQEKVVMNGDIRVAQQLQSILSDIDIDWEEWLAQYTGDVAAVQISKQLRGIHHWLKQSADSLMQSGSEYLREESQMSPTGVEFERFSETSAEKPAMQLIGPKRASISYNKI